MGCDPALAYAEGYAKALEDCDRADVGTLIKERHAAQVSLTIERALRSDSERRLEEARAWAATQEQKARDAEATNTELLEALERMKKDENSKD